LLLFELAELCQSNGVGFDQAIQKLNAHKEEATGQTEQLLSYAFRRIDNWGK